MHYLDIKQQVEAVCAKLGRDHKSLLLLPVSKAHSAEAIREVCAQGAEDFAENRPDVLLEKEAKLGDIKIRWHFIGNIQSRRIKDIVAHCEFIHSLEKIKHASKIDAAAADLGKVQKVLVEVNVSGEEQKGGIAPEQLPQFLEDCMELEHLQVCGLMCIAPFQADESTLIEVFTRLKQALFSTKEFLGSKQASYKELSMGMSGDWRSALACGSTMLRIGTAIFSD